MTVPAAPAPEIRNRKGIGGPKTAEGKRRSSLNALKHGLTARSSHARRLIEHESGADPFQILACLAFRCRPTTPEQREIVARMLQFVLKYVEAAAMQRRILRTRGPDRRYSPAYLKLEQCKQMQQVHLHRAAVALARLKKPRPKIRLNRTQRAYLELKRARSVLRMLHEFSLRESQKTQKRTDPAGPGNPFRALRSAPARPPPNLKADS